MNQWLHWRYKNISLVLFGILFALLLSQVQAFHAFLLHLGNFGYLGTFIAGMLFVNTFTVSTGALILLTLSKQLIPIEIGLIAGLGTVIGDLIIFRFVEDDLAKELELIYEKIDYKHHFLKLLHSKYFH